MWPAPDYNDNNQKKKGVGGFLLSYMAIWLVVIVLFF